MAALAVFSPEIVPTAAEEIQPVLKFAIEAHAGQTRSGSGLPFVVHPVAVLAMIASWGVRCPILWKAALCHDVLEDCPHISHDKLNRLIGSEAMGIVTELTFKTDPANNLSKYRQKEMWLGTFREKSLYSLVIKWADRVHNTRDFLNSDPGYAAKYWRQARLLAEAVFSRSLEVEFDGRLGPDVSARMRYARTMLDREVVR